MAFRGGRIGGLINREQQQVIEYDRIEGAMLNLGHRVRDTIIGRILKAHGIDPAPRRRKQGCWSTFLKAHWEHFAAMDFWMRDPGVWPRRRSRNMFLEWFDVQVCEMVFDLGRGAIHYD